MKLIDDENLIETFWRRPRIVIVVAWIGLASLARRAISCDPLFSPHHRPTMTSSCRSHCIATAARLILVFGVLVQVDMMPGFHHNDDHSNLTGMAHESFRAWFLHMIFVNDFCNSLMSPMRHWGPKGIPRETPALRTEIHSQAGFR